MPLMHLFGIVCFGDVMVSPALIHKLAEQDQSLVFLDFNRRFKARIQGPTKGNVLLRKNQHFALLEKEKVISIARNIIAAKIKNSRHIILRAARETDDDAESSHLEKVAQKLNSSLLMLQNVSDLEQLRGIEGEAAKAYFETFNIMIRVDREHFKMNGRTKRPPLDPVNALLSFLYTLLLNDYVAALEGVGLDPQVGFLHTLRPGRPALALDLMEEIRSVLADRLMLTLVNRKQINADEFELKPGGAVLLNDNSRKEVIIAYQKRKKEEIVHPLLDQKMPFGLIPHIQARILARYLRGDLQEYLPFIYK
jgi:CRISPR-associated protein Cas1